MLEDISDVILKKRASAELGILKEIETWDTQKTFGISLLPEQNVLPTLLEFYKNLQPENIN